MSLHQFKHKEHKHKHKYIVRRFRIDGAPVSEIRHRNGGKHQVNGFTVTHEDIMIAKRDGELKRLNVA